MSARIGGFYCEICKLFETHYKLSQTQLMIEMSESFSDRFITKLGKYSGLNMIIYGISKLFGRGFLYKCGECGGYVMDQNSKEHCYYIDDKWWYLKELESNPTILHRVREKYNPHLLETGGIYDVHFYKDTL